MYFRNWAREISVADAFDDFLACLTFFDPVTLGIIFRSATLHRSAWLSRDLPILGPAIFMSQAINAFCLILAEG
jgi:hypothetical protein